MREKKKKKKRKRGGKEMFGDDVPALENQMLPTAASATKARETRVCTILMVIMDHDQGVLHAFTVSGPSSGYLAQKIEKDIGGRTSSVKKGGKGRRREARDFRQAGIPIFRMTTSGGPSGLAL
jgi:hypothetical protein